MVLYEKAKADGGYQGTFKQWHLENTKTRTSGPLPYISTLKHKAFPADSDMIRLSPHYRSTKGTSEWWAMRHIMLNGKDLGIVQIWLRPTSIEENEEIWLRPYFDPTTRCLRLQRRDGSDYSYTRNLQRLAAYKYLRPFLHLAHGEGLLESIPDDRLSSLRFNTAHDSGFAVHYKVRRVPEPFCEVYLRLRYKGAIDKYQIRFRPVIPPDQQVVTFFPYVGKSGLLHLWDTFKGGDLALRGRGRTVSGYEPKYVREQWPKLFELAQSEGFWAGEAPLW
ncbi:hypothetical protein FRB93_000390 [Tulasnella sp. JGI-2019a]|nr:hypothetical protein FRB93_000390 [Tulasnella sp. JGI-2019a]